MGPAGQGDDEGSGSLSSEEGGGGASSSDADEEIAHDSMAREAMIRDEMPVIGGFGRQSPGHWSRLGIFIPGMIGFLRYAMKVGCQTIAQCTGD